MSDDAKTISGLTHLDREGRVAMVDCRRQGHHIRRAKACGTVHLAEETLALVVGGN